MSQYVRLSLNVLDCVKPSLIAKAVQKMGHGLKLKPANSVKASGITRGATGIVFVNQAQTNIGFSLAKNGDKTRLNVIGDFLGSGLEQKSFVRDFCKAYRVTEVQQMVEERNMTLLHRNVEEDGTIVLRYAV